jgi:hypothetical protein
MVSRRLMVDKPSISAPAGRPISSIIVPLRRNPRRAAFTVQVSRYTKQSSEVDVEVEFCGVRHGGPYDDGVQRVSSDNMQAFGLDFEFSLELKRIANQLGHFMLQGESLWHQVPADTTCRANYWNLHSATSRLLPAPALNRF